MSCLMTHSRRVTFVALTALLSLAYGCKTASHGGNELEAINIDSTATDAPICKGTATEDFKSLFESLWPQDGTDEQARKTAPINAQSGYKPYLEKILPAVPVGLLSWYFRFGGRLNLVAKASEACASTGNEQIMLPFTNEKGDVAGCVKSTAQGSDRMTVNIPEIFVEIDVTNVESVYKTASNAIQGFSIIASFFLTELKKDESSADGTTLSFGNQELFDLKSNLAFFMTDDFANNGQTVPTALKQMFPDQSVWDKKIARDTRWRSFVKQKSINANAFSQFINTVFAQVLAADMCNDATRKQLSPEGPLFGSVGKQYYNAIREPLMTSIDSVSTSVLADDNPNAASNSTALVGTTTSSKKAPVVPTSQTSLGLDGYVRFPILHAVVTFPFAVVRYFVNERPILTFFQTYQPIRTTLRFTVNAAATVIQGTGQVIRTTGHVALHVVTFPFRLLTGNL